MGLDARRVDETHPVTIEILQRIRTTLEAQINTKRQNNAYGEDSAFARELLRMLPEDAAVQSLGAMLADEREAKFASERLRLLVSDRPVDLTDGEQISVPAFRNQFSLSVLPRTNRSVGCPAFSLRLHYQAPQFLVFGSDSCHPIF